MTPAKPAGDPPLACNPNAISPADRPRYRNLMERLRSAVVRQTQLTDGYSYELDLNRLALTAVAEWIALESLCCPFLTFRLDIKPGGETYLTLRGPEGVKAILRAEFPTR